MSVLFSQCGLGMDVSMQLTPREPAQWNYKVVTQVDANGNPLYANYYFDDQLVFSQQSTYNSQSKEMSIKIYMP